MKAIEQIWHLLPCERAVAWLGDRTLPQAWAECARADWMLWLLARAIGRPSWPTHQVVMLCACDCASTVLRHVPRGDRRPALAIRAARRWARGEVSAKYVSKRAFAASAAAARTAARAAAVYNTAASATYAATAASSAARTAAVYNNASYAATFAATAASSAASSAARTAAVYNTAASASYAATFAATASRGDAHRHLADLVRKRVPTIPEVW